MGGEKNSPTLTDAMLARRERFVCPKCGGDLDPHPDGARIACATCGQSFGCESGIPLLFWPNEWTGKSDVTQIVRAFYEETPFPNYDDIDSELTLREKAEKGLFARWLDEQIPYGSMVVEVGCGTGQLSNFLGLSWGRTVFGTDLCLNSLRLANDFKVRHGISRVSFYQMNLFRPIFKQETFDFVVCSGVLHHTSDPFLGFQTIARLAKIGGHVIVGLYNRYGRITTDIRRLVFKITGDRLRSLDPRLRTRGLSETRKRAWFMDQYRHPHESTHTIGEVLRWFDRCGVSFVSSIPKCQAFQEISAQEKLFGGNPPGTPLDHFLVQTGMFLRGGKEGGFFVMIGRRER